MSTAMSIFLILAALGLGCWLGERDARKKARGWRTYPQKFDIMKDCR